MDIPGLSVKQRLKTGVVAYVFPVVEVLDGSGQRVPDDELAVVRRECLCFHQRLSRRHSRGRHGSDPGKQDHYQERSYQCEPYFRCFLSHSTYFLTC